MDPTPQPANPRMRIAVFFTGLIIIALHLLHFNVNSRSRVSFITFVGFLLGMGLYGVIIVFGIVATEAAPIALSGTTHAIVALAANRKFNLKGYRFRLFLKTVGAIMSGLPFATIASYTSWSMVFLLLECLSITTLMTLILTRNVTAHIIPSKSF